MVIKLPVNYEGAKGTSNLFTLFDSGATLSCINPSKAEALGTLEKLHRHMLLGTASEGQRIEVTHCVRLDFYLNEVRLSDEFLLVPGLSEEAIIGAATMQKWRIKLDFEHDSVIVDPAVAKLILI